MGRRTWTWVAGAVSLGALGLWGARLRAEEQADDVERRLAGSGMRGFFHPDCLEPLPPPARRWLGRAIASGAPLAPSARLETRGRIRLAPGGGWLPFQGVELMAPPRGYAWRARIGRGPWRYAGHELALDGVARAAWWAGGVLPVARAAGPDVDRSAAGRVALGAVWVPSALLPGTGAAWEPVDDHTADVTLPVGRERPRLRVTVDSEGRLVRAHVLRWRADADPPGLEPFGFDRVIEEGTFGGYRVPTRVIAGWSLGAAQAFPFYDLRVARVSYG